jgi:ubiquitin carboxyl-terminal hydrolase 34
MWQVCGYIPQTLLSQGQDFTEISAQLSTSFFIETFIHAKEKVTIIISALEWYTWCTWKLETGNIM